MATRPHDRNPFACPACGNSKRDRISDNGCQGLDLTLCCLDEEHGDCNDGEPGACGMQWDPAQELAEVRPEWDRSDDREAIRRWWAGDPWDGIRCDLDEAIRREREERAQSAPEYGIGEGIWGCGRDR